MCLNFQMQNQVKSYIESKLVNWHLQHFEADLNVAQNLNHNFNVKLQARSKSGLTNNSNTSMQLTLN